tara:strand:- start:2073 stop:2270 length:198 start_codon:yes stop_codon:yes gene_type:complete
MTHAPASIFHPELEDLTENERAWLGFLRLITQDTDPAPTLARVQALHCVFSTPRSSDEDDSLDGP